MRKRDGWILLSCVLIIGFILGAGGCAEPEENFYKPTPGTSAVVFSVEGAPLETITIFIFNTDYELLTTLTDGEDTVYLSPADPEHYYADFADEEGRHPFVYDGRYPSDDLWLYTPNAKGASLRVYNVESPGIDPPFWMEVCPHTGGACI